MDLSIGNFVCVHQKAVQLGTRRMNWRMGREYPLRTCRAYDTTGTNLFPRAKTVGKSSKNPTESISLEILVGKDL
jgi:hypothetical protein